MAKLFFLVLITTAFYTHTRGSLVIENPGSQSNHALDTQLYKDVLDPELCQKQINYLLTNDTLTLARLLDAGIRTPKGMLEGNLVDMGNYHQCLGIKQALPDFSIQGKYCTISVPLLQELELPTWPVFPEWPDLEWPDIPWPELNPNTSRLSSTTLENVRRLRSLQLEGVTNRAGAAASVEDASLNLAMCIPHACTTREAFDGLLFNTSAVGFQYVDNFCRLPDDKPWVAADYVTIIVFSVIGLLIILSTAYDLRHNVFLKRDPNTINRVLQSFSVYTNTRRLVTYTPMPGAIECIDGIRVIAILWVIVGHTYITHLNKLANPLDAVNWMVSFGSLWVMSAPITVDTFFMLSGLLVVYTTAGKLTRMNLLKNLHLFYLNRLLRMFPILAAAVLIQASILNRIADGPDWNTVVENTDNCRVFWWTTLLHVQNFVSPHHMCLPHTWYLAIDVQLHIVSPLVLFWLLGGRKRTAWIALTVAMVVALVPASIYNTINEFSTGPISLSRPVEDQARYMVDYYTNTMTRCSPFFVGIIYGYLLHINKGRLVVIPKLSVAVLWLCAITISTTVIVSTYPTLQFDWDNQPVDTLINCLSRPAWAVAIGWMIFACVHGYAGPINWFLSLHMWKFPSRLSYAMYILHFNIMLMINDKAISPVHFTVFNILYRSFADLVLTFIVSYILTVGVDSPCSTLIKHFLGGPKRPITMKPTIEEDINDEKFNGNVNRAYISDETKADIKL